MEETEPEIEVSYKESATPLFLAIEEMEWRKAFHIIESHPHQARTWVRSTGTDGTTFDWSIWRRLPIHEACIRRAPAWLVSKLLSSFPESASLTTNLGEYPLHLAVDKACAPEVVNLIIVSNWKAIASRDQAGRTPLDIINRAELLDIEENLVVFESLKLCQKTFLEIQTVANDEKEAMKRKHKVASMAILKKHKDDMEKEQKKQARLQNEIRELKLELKDIRESMNVKDGEIQKNVLVQKRMTQTARELEATKAEQCHQLEIERKQIKILEFQLSQKDEEIMRKDTKIETLSKDLSNIATSNEKDILESLTMTEKSMRRMIENHMSLQNLMISKSNELKNLLKQRGIAFPTTSTKRNDELEEEKSPHFESVYDDDAAGAAMMAAAMAALQQKN